jgi:SAM-dependent methyltransferase
MNRLHRWYCRSNRWKKTLENEILPWSLEGVRLGDECPRSWARPGSDDRLATASLHKAHPASNWIKNSRVLLPKRMTGNGVRVDRGDGTAMPYPDGSVSTVVLFTVLHHVPSAALQNRLFAEASRVLKPSGTFAGVDSMQSLLMRLFHIGDTMVLVNPGGLEASLESAGFREIATEVGKGRFRFRAQRPLKPTR